MTTRHAIGAAVVDALATSTARSRAGRIKVVLAALERAGVALPEPIAAEPSAAVENLKEVECHAEPSQMAGGDLRADGDVSAPAADPVTITPGDVPVRRDPAPSPPTAWWPPSIPTTAATRRSAGL
ncbi:MAG: hypothetical protein ACOCY0_04625 [Roseicyclus sp.]